VHVGVEGVQPARAEAGVSSRRVATAARDCATSAGYLGAVAAEAAFRDGDDVAGRDDRDDRGQPRALPRLLPAGVA
jgi:hypothetical protein